jgi:hypothetical protein
MEFRGPLKGFFFGEKSTGTAGVGGPANRRADAHLPCAAGVAQLRHSSDERNLGGFGHRQHRAVGRAQDGADRFDSDRRSIGGEILETH